MRTRIIVQSVYIGEIGVGVDQSIQFIRGNSGSVYLDTHFLAETGDFLNSITKSKRTVVIPRSVRTLGITYPVQIIPVFEGKYLR